MVELRVECAVYYIVFLSQVNLRLLLVDGKTHDFIFELSAKASEIASHVFHNWPSGNCTNTKLLCIDPNL